MRPAVRFSCNVFVCVVCLSQWNVVSLGCLSRWRFLDLVVDYRLLKKVALPYSWMNTSKMSTKGVSNEKWRHNAAFTATEALKDTKTQWRWRKCVYTPPLPIYGNYHQYTVLRAQAAVEKDWIIVTGRQGCGRKGGKATGLGRSASVPDIAISSGQVEWITVHGNLRFGCASGDGKLTCCHRISYWYAGSVLRSLQEQQFVLTNRRQQFIRPYAELAVTTPGSLK